MHVAITGASGFIGTMLAPALRAAGHRITRMVRHPPDTGEIRWDPAGSGIEPAALKGINAVVHLAGESIAGHRWSPEHKARIRETRLTPTRLLADAILRSRQGPRLLVQASAIGIYGDRGDEELTENSPPGSGFLPEVAVAWEEASRIAEAAGVRVVRVRIGLLLAPEGGLLQRMLLPFRLGLGGPQGNGRQWMSWIAADDLVRVFGHVLASDSIFGAVNAVAPHPVRNREFARTLGRVLRRPAILPVPAFALRLLFGEMADALILSGARVRPSVLEGSGFSFQYPELQPALEHLLRR
jgi:uncharacterized protein (TIGR01777 family)